MDPADTKSYLPISNLSVLSKLLERLVSKQLVTYLKDNSLLPDRQSAYLAHHSTETAGSGILGRTLLWITNRGSQVDRSVSVLRP